MSSPSTPVAKRGSASHAPLTFKFASEDWEFEQIYRLNYETFVEEIPQHGLNSTRILVDRFDDENTYVICLRGSELLGMVSARGNRPFSLDQKLENLDSYLPEGRSICEVRLLAVNKEHRAGPVLHGLLTMLARYCMSQGYNIAIVSGTVTHLDFYKRLGFVPFGPGVGTPDALYQPMYKELDNLKTEFDGRFRNLASHTNGTSPVNLLPGPVRVSREVKQAFEQPPVSHRSRAFVKDFKETKNQLSRLVKSRHVEILMGSGTMANDVIAGQLSLEAGHGLIVSNGEFGDRLIDHASRMRLSFSPLQVDWGHLFDRGQIERALDRSPRITWMWAAHSETSSGVLNDAALLKEICAERDIRLCLDCISTVGTIPVDLSGVYLASGVSGKGLGAFPGLSMVFYDHKVAQAPKALPRYLDLGLYASKDGVAFTMSSNLVYALRAALQRFQSGSERVFGETAQASSVIRRRLRALGFGIVAPDAHASPAVITIALPQTMSSENVGALLEEAGYLLSYNSDYLRERNWIQICLMGDFSQESIEPLLEVLRHFRPRPRSTPRTPAPVGAV